MSIHICDVCYNASLIHPEQCLVPDCPGHWPALCCPGCGCGSFEEAHPGVTVGYVDEGYVAPVKAWRP